MMITTHIEAPIEIVKSAIERRGGTYTEKGIYIITNCPGPNHQNGDQHPSLHIWETITDDGRTTIRTKCHSGRCTPADIYKGFGINSNSIPAISFSSPKEPIITLFDLAEHIGIDWQILFNLGWEDSVATLHRPDGTPYKLRGVIHRYRHEDGTLCERHKLRIRLAKVDKKPRWVWTEGDETVPIAYGLEILIEAIKRGFLVIVEGESDWATLYGCYGIPCLGIPGAGQVATTLDANMLKDIPRVYVIQEQTDQAGVNFPYAVQVRLRETGYTGEILRVPLKTLTDAKDPNELHKRLIPEMREARSTAPFTEAFQQALDRAKPMDTDTGEDGQKCEIDTSSLDQAIEKKDYDKLTSNLSALARLTKKEYLPYEPKIKAAFGKQINMNTFHAAVAEERKRIASESSFCEENNREYEKTDAGMIYYTPKGDSVRITNFTAEIQADITTDDGAEHARSYMLTAEILGRRKVFEVPARDFTVATWVDEHLGARARITTGNSMKSHMINAIKYCSQPTEQFHYAHTGWRLINGEMVYLHAGGCVSQVSQVSQVNSGVSVKLTGALSHYCFPDEKGNIQKAICSSLDVLNVTHDTITAPLVSSAYRAVLPSVDYGIHMAGQTGLGKTELAAVIQQHFGPAMDSHHLPGSWESTENSLEALLFQAKDAVVVVDDFKPKGSKQDQDRQHMKADRVFRQVGNGSARGRLNSNLEQRAERRPRCLLISTGEDIPRGQSLKARAVVLTLHAPLTSGDASRKLLAAQKNARSGLYAQAMASFIKWLAPQIADIQERMPELIEGEREQLHIDGHARTSTNTANMLLGMRYFLRFAYESGAITEEEVQSYLTRCISAFKQIARDAFSENTNDKPSEQWRRLIIAALTNKSAHLVNDNGDNPGLQYGWSKSIRNVVVNGEEVKEETYRGGGSQIGWIDGDDIYLLPTAAYKAASAIGSSTGDDITTSERMLRRFLAQDGLLASTDLGKARNTVTVRHRLEAMQRDVLHIKRVSLFPDDPPTKLPDSLDLLDSNHQEGTGEATSVGESSNGSESSMLLDSPQPLFEETRQNDMGLFSASENSTSQASSDETSIPEEARALYAKLKADPVFNKRSSTLYQGSYLPCAEYFKQLQHQLCTPEEYHAALYEIHRQLKKLEVAL